MLVDYERDDMRYSTFLSGIQCSSEKQEIIGAGQGRTFIMKGAIRMRD